MAARTWRAPPHAPAARSPSRSGSTHPAATTYAGACSAPRRCGSRPPRGSCSPCRRRQCSATASACAAGSSHAGRGGSRRRSTDAGSRLSRAGGMRLGTPRVGAREVRLRLVPNPGFASVRRDGRMLVVVPELGPGSHGPAVRELERRLREQRYVLQRVDASYDLDTTEAVYAFQSVHGLAQTGRVDAALWRLIARSGVPTARQPGTHIEVSKANQYLLDVRGGPRRPRDPRLDGRNRQHAARHMARLPHGARLRLGPLLPALLPPRLRDPRLPLRAAVSRLARLRADPDVDRDEPLLRPRPAARRSSSTSRAERRPDLGAARAESRRPTASSWPARTRDCASWRSSHGRRPRAGSTSSTRSRSGGSTDALVEANIGPLSEAGVRELVAAVLELTKRELGRAGS